MNKTLVIFTCGLAFFCSVAVTPAQTITIIGNGSGTLNGVAFANKNFDWTLYFSLANPNTSAGDNYPIYAVSSSQITLQGVESPLKVTDLIGFENCVDFAAYGQFILAPVTVDETGANIGDVLDIYGSPSWDGTSSFTSDPNPEASFDQCYVGTDQGTLHLSSGTVSSLGITVEAVPEPSTLALSAMSGLGSLLLFRRRK